jgi:YjjG family noncanonical pyrimidine nucleotidase
VRIPRFIFFDLDNTLVDHTAGLRDALRRVCQSCPRLLAGTAFDEAVTLFERINDELWGSMAAGEITPAILRLERFRRLSQELAGEDSGVPSPQELSDRYMSAYVEEVRAYEGVLNLLERLQGRHTLGIISNGFAETQRYKLRACGIEPLVEHQVYSEEVAASKPDPAIFTAALALAGASPDEAIYVGDNFHSDISGAARAGLATVWFNPSANGASNTSADVEPDAVVRSIEELSALLGAGSAPTDRTNNAN